MSTLLLPVLSVSAQAIEVVEGEPVSVLGRDESQQDSRVSTQVRIPEPSSTGYQNSAINTVSGPTSNSAELFVRFQSLQDEVRELRGLVEQQAYLIEQLSQRRMDDYLDLDRRIGELSQGSSNKLRSSANSANNAVKVISTRKTPPATASNTKPYQTNKSADRVVPSPPKAVEVIDSEEARQAYRAAYQKIKTGDFEVAQIQLLAFVDKFPSGADVPVALFWLGELQLQDSSIDKSLGSYSRLVEDYPQHRKVPAAKFKLGKIHQQKGDTAKAKSYLKSVINDHSGSSAAKLARDYLNSLK